VIEPLFDCD